MSPAICVFCSSSDAVDPAFFAAAVELGALIVQHGYSLVYGGARVGLMGAVARTVHECGGQVIGVLPETTRDLELAYEYSDELIVTRNLRERKAMMEERADAIVALPGGFGTLEELLEIITLKQLRLVVKPLVLLNVNGFYDPLLHLFDHIYEHRFARPSLRSMYHVVASPADVFPYLATYSPPEAGRKPL